MQNCPCHSHSFGMNIRAGGVIHGSDLSSQADQNSLQSSPLAVLNSQEGVVHQALRPTKKFAPETSNGLVVGSVCNTALDMLNGVGAFISAPKPESDLNLSRTPSTQPLTGTSSSLLSSNQHFVETLREMSADSHVGAMINELRTTHPTLASSLQSFLDAGDGTQKTLEAKVKNSTAWLTVEEAIPFKNHLFDTLHTLAKQPKMRVITLEKLSNQQDLAALRNRMFAALQASGLLPENTTEITLPVLPGGSKQNQRNTLLLEITEGQDKSSDEGSHTCKPLRLFFASGDQLLPEEFFQKNGVLDICEGKLEVQAQGKRKAYKKLRSTYMQSPEFALEVTDKFNKCVEQARATGKILVLETPTMQALGVFGERVVPRVQDSPKSDSDSSNGRTLDTEHLAINFLLKKGAALGLETLKKDLGGTKYKLDLVSRFPICRSCHLGLAAAVTHENFPRLSEFNVVHGPKQH